MVVLFSNRKSKTKKEIIEILTHCGAGYVSDRKIIASKNSLNVISEYKPIRLDIKKGIAILVDNASHFENQDLAEGIIGICESENKNALKVFENNKTPVITCGMNPKSTVTVSSLNTNYMLISLQRSFSGMVCKEIEPQELKIKLSKKYEPFSVMASAVILLLYGIEPFEF